LSRQTARSLRAMVAGSCAVKTSSTTSGSRTRRSASRRLRGSVSMADCRSPRRSVGARPTRRTQRRRGPAARPRAGCSPHPHARPANRCRAAQGLPGSEARLTMPEHTPMPEVPAEAARALQGAIPVLCCPACGKPLRHGQRACSGKCRAALSRQRQEQARQARDQEIRVLLESALRRLSE
jgi:predicted nucleic acid-binding Zn ribbon protein